MVERLIAHGAAIALVESTMSATPTSIPSGAAE